MKRNVRRSSTDAVRQKRWRKPIAAGIAASLLLFAAYFALLSALNSPAHAWQQFLDLGYLMLPLIAGFGTQVGLFVHVRAVRACSAGGVATGGGVSGVAMAACCAHHLADVAAILGISAAVAFLGAYQGPLLALGVLSNALGIVYMLRKLKE